VRYHRWRNSQCRPRDVKLRFFKNYENLWEITIDIHCNTIHILYVYHPILGTSSSGKLHIPNEEVLQAGFTLSQLWSPWGRHRRIRKRQRRNEFDRDTQLYTEELIQVRSDLLYRQFRNFQNVSNALYISLYIIYIYIHIYIHIIYTQFIYIYTYYIYTQLYIYIYDISCYISIQKRKCWEVLMYRCIEHDLWTVMIGWEKWFSTKEEL
jgi:hypothetical protein